MIYPIQILKNQNDFHKGLKDLNEEMRQLLSDLMDLKDHVKIDSLRISVIKTMKAILEASQYIRDYLETNKSGEYDSKKNIDVLTLSVLVSRKTTVGPVFVEA